MCDVLVERDARQRQLKRKARARDAAAAAAVAVVWLLRLVLTTPGVCWQALSAACGAVDYDTRGRKEEGTHPNPTPTHTHRSQ